MTLTVDLGERSYPIHIARDLSGALRREVDSLQAAGKKMAVIVDSNVEAAQGEWRKAAFGDVPHLVLPAGEGTKSFQNVAAICEFLVANRLDRSSVLVAFGGGVIGDLAGFAAASYLRGIQFIQVPTTLLAMVDSSVGGKTGVNLQSGKNLAGAFWQPQSVWADLALLDTLPAREFSAGMAEVIKYGLLGDDALFKRLESLPRLDPKSDELASVIECCCAIKASIVRDDERETASSGGRALLNLGHTFAHSIENVAGYGTYLHGEAVGLGLLLAGRLSCELGCIGKGEVDRVRDLLNRYELPTRLRAPLRVQDLKDVMWRDKKVRDGKLRFVVMKAIGNSVTMEGIDRDLVRSIWREVGAV